MIKETNLKEKTKMAHPQTKKINHCDYDGEKLDNFGECKQCEERIMNRY